MAAEFARVAFSVGRYDLAVEPIELALDVAEALKLPQVLAEALNTKGVLLWRRATESEALIRQAIRVALSRRPCRDGAPRSVQPRGVVHGT